MRPGQLAPARAIEAGLDAPSQWRLCEGHDGQVESGFAGLRSALNLLETVTGIKGIGARASEAELDPDLVRTFGNSESAGKRLSGRSKGTHKRLD